MPHSSHLVPAPAGPPVRGREQGASTILVVLMTASILLITAGITSSMSLGSRSRTADEYVAYQNLQAAESALDTFNVRAVIKGPFPRIVCASGTAAQKDSCAQTRLAGWLATTGLNVVNTVQGNVSLEAANPVLDAAGRLLTFDVRATAALSSGRGRALQTYRAMPASRSPLPALPAAVVSVPNIIASGSVNVAGMSASTYPESLSAPANVTLTAPATLTPGQLSLLPNAGLESVPVGQYVTLNGATVRVEGNEAGKLMVRPLRLSPATASTQTLPAGAVDTRIVLGGIRGVSATSVTLTDPQMYLPGDKVEMTVGGSPYAGTLGTFNAATGAWSVSWSKALPVVPEGTSLRREVVSAATKDTFTLKTSNVSAFPIGQQYVADNRLAPAANDALFWQVFGTDSATLLSTVTPISGQTFDGAVNNLTVVNGNTNMNSSKLCGSGVLIVTGNLSINQNNSACPAGQEFNGLIYVRGGDITVQGNIAFRGAVVVEGATNLDNTKFAGTSQVIYDPAALYRALASAAPLTLKADAYTWRQQ